jgi:hypothetical protein
VNTNLYVTPSQIQISPGPVGGKPFRPEGPIGRRSPWRKLVVLVTPEGVEASWQKGEERPESVAEPTGKALAEFLHDSQVVHPKAQVVRADYLPRGGLGLYVRAGKASFRRVTIEPLAGPD